MSDANEPPGPVGGSGQGRFLLQWKRSALDDAKTLTKRVREQVARLIERLADDPQPPGSGPLGYRFRGLYKLDAGDYRIIYLVDRHQLIITIVLIGNRRNVYQRLGRMLGGR